MSFRRLPRRTLANSMKPVIEVKLDGELDRIRAEYARRRQEIAPDFYGWQRVVTQYYLSRITTAAIRGLATIDLFPLDGRSVLDIGCGEGNWLPDLSQFVRAARALAPRRL